jgi:hypothetical protein
MEHRFNTDGFCVQSVFHRWLKSGLCVLRDLRGAVPFNSPRLANPPNKEIATSRIPGFILGSSWVRPGFVLGSSWVRPGLQKPNKPRQIHVLWSTKRFFKSERPRSVFWIANYHLLTLMSARDEGRAMRDQRSAVRDQRSEFRSQRSEAMPDARFMRRRGEAKSRFVHHRCFRVDGRCAADPCRKSLPANTLRRAKFGAPGTRKREGGARNAPRHGRRSYKPDAQASEAVRSFASASGLCYLSPREV